MEVLPSIRLGRTSFAAHYDFLDRHIYVIGGSNSKDEMITDCEKFDVFERKWEPMPSMIHKRGNPGTFISADKRWLYAF